MYKSVHLSDSHLTKIKHYYEKKKVSQLYWRPSFFCYKHKGIHTGDGQAHQPTKSKILAHGSFSPVCAFGYRVTVFLVRIAFHITEDRFFFCFFLLHYPNIQISICHPLIREWAAHFPWQIWSALSSCKLKTALKVLKKKKRHPKVTMCFRITEALITYIAVSLFFAPLQMVIDLNSVSPTAVFLSTFCSRASK